MRKWLRKRKGLVAAVGLATVAIVAFGIVRGAGTQEEITTYTTEPAQIGTLSVTVSGSGNAYVGELTEVWPEVSGEVATIEVAEGDEASAGDVLYTLTSDDLDDETAKLLASYRQAQEGYERSELSVMQAEDSIDGLDAAADRLYVSYLQAQQSYERAGLDLDKTQVTLDELVAASTDPSSTVTPADIDGAEKQLEIAQLALEAAEISLASAEAAYEEAVSDSADDVAQQNLTIAELGLTSSSASLVDAKEAYGEAIADHDELVVTAPHDGVVRTLGIEVGDTLSAGDTGTSISGGAATTASNTSEASSVPVVLVSNEPLSVEIEINEVDMPGLDLGQKTEIIFDAMPDLTFSGEVAEIDDEGSNTQGVVTYYVRIKLYTSHDDLRAGMTASATIVTAIVQDALLVPNAALKTDDASGGEYVEVLAAGAETPRIVPVQTGLYNVTHTVITSGLEAGESVVTATKVTSDEEESNGSFGIPGMGGGPGR